MTPTDIDVAIVGGGIAGLYAAWQLSKIGGRTVHLFEASDRLGGRIRTVLTSGGWPVELGARTVRGDDKLLLSLLDTFGIDVAAMSAEEAEKQAKNFKAES